MYTHNPPEQFSLVTRAESTCVERCGGRARIRCREEVNGRTRHVVVDTMGLLLLVLITWASVQDRDGARTLLDRVKMAIGLMVRRLKPPGRKPWHRASTAG